MDISKGVAVVALAGMALIGHSALSGADAPQSAPVFITMPAPAPSASICEVRCPGYVEPDTDYHPAPRFLYEKPTVPTNGVVTVYVAAPAQQVASVTPRASKGASPAKASSPKASSKASSAKAPRASAQSKGPTTTVTNKTVTGPKGTTTTHTVTTKGLTVSAGQAATSTGG